MASKSLILLGLLFAIILVISSDVVSARNEPGVAETKGVQVDGHDGGHHKCHHPHCSEESGHEKENDGDVDGHEHHEHKCKHWPHC